MKQNVLIVDDHAFMRVGLAAVIDQQPDLRVCAAVEDGAKALAAVATSHPQIAVVDLSLEGRSGLELIKDFTVQHPQLPVLVLSMHDESLYAERALRAGARGYVMKREPTKDLVTAIRKVLGGGLAFSEQISNRLLNSIRQGDRPAAHAPDWVLGDRELEVFTLLGQGRKTREIARQLGLSVKTISAHREHIKEKLGIANANELIRHAVHWATRQQVE